MLDQSFTPENFRKIYDEENRKGVDLAKKYFPTLLPHTLGIRNKVAEIRTLRAAKAALKPEIFVTAEAKLKQELVALKDAKSAEVQKQMEAISALSLQTPFKITLTQHMGPKGKLVYRIGPAPEVFFVVKQLQRNVNRIYGVKPANRHDLVCQLRDTLRSRFPFEFVRTDIASFYESIDRKKLLEKLDRDQLLSSSSKKYVKQILVSYGLLSGSPLGIPRGVGISAYLAELYLRQVDRDIREVEGLVLYCRYVDDIVSVFARPPTGHPLGQYRDIVLQVLSKHGLSHNPKKTTEFSLAEDGKKKFEYLGYRFLLDNGACAISPSASKMRKFKLRIQSSFSAYEATESIDPRRAYRDLVSRVKFLTGNTRLANSKSGATTGVFYNNSIVTDLSSFKLLDKMLATKRDELLRPNLRKRLRAFKFVEGFTTRRYHKFTTRELGRIVEVWKHA